MKTENTFTIVGKLLRVIPYTSPAGKSYPQAVIDVPDDKYPQVTAVKFFGRSADKLGEFPPGTVLKITGSLGGREWQGKVFPELKGFQIEAVGEIPAAQPTGEVDCDESSTIPF